MKAIMREAINLKPILPTKKLPKESISYCMYKYVQVELTVMFSYCGSPSSLL